MPDIARQADEAPFSAIVLGELPSGVGAGSRRERYAEASRYFLASRAHRFATVARATADHYGIVATGRRREGHTSFPNDAWIGVPVLETCADRVSSGDCGWDVEGVAWRKPGTR